MNQPRIDLQNAPTAYQQAVADFVKRHDLEAPLESRLLDLIAEIGELSKEALKGNAYGRQEYQATQDWEGELGDVFFSLICLANTTGVNMQAALQGVLEKCQNRLDQSGAADSGF